MSAEDDQAYIRMMFGSNAVFCGFNYIVQEVEDGKVLIVAQSTSRTAAHPLRFGSKRTHVMAMGDVVFRPHIVLGSDKLQGRGMTSIAKDGFLDMDAWGDSADLILDSLGEIAKLRRSSA